MMLSCKKAARGQRNSVLNCSCGNQRGGENTNSFPIFLIFVCSIFLCKGERLTWLRDAPVAERVKSPLSLRLSEKLQPAKCETKSSFPPGTPVSPPCQESSGSTREAESVQEQTDHMSCRAGRLSLQTEKPKKGRHILGQTLATDSLPDSAKKCSGLLSHLRHAQSFKSYPSSGSQGTAF